ncbi:hypothetical protein Tco_0008164 [Tanacetum coccineum]
MGVYNQATQTLITHNADNQGNELGAYDSDVMNLSLPKLPNGEFITLCSDATLKAVVQNSKSSAQQYALILSVIEQLKTQLEPKLYDGNVIKNTSAIVIPDSEETLMLAEESRSKMLLKQKDPMMLEKKVNTTPVDYANSVNSLEPTLSSRPTKVEVPKELPKVSMVNTSLKKLKYHLAGFDVVVKERTTPTAITEGSWGFKHTISCFRDEIIPFVKALKDLFNIFDQYLIDELSEVQNVFHQIEQAMEQHRLESKTFEVKINQVLNENKQLLEQVINKDIVNIIMNSSVDIAYVNMHECKKCLKLKTELLNKKDFVEKEIYDKLFKIFITLEKYCISLEVDSQINQEIFQRDNSVSNQNAPSFDQLFELNELKAQSQEKDTVIKKLKERIKSLSGKINEDKIKKDLEDIETINIELDRRVSKLIAENEHLKQTYKQLYDSIKPARIRSKEQCDDLINQFNLKSVEISDLNPSLQEKVLVITTLKDDLRKLKGKSLVDNDVTKHPSDPEMLKIDVQPITPKLYAKRIQDLLTNINKTCPSINNAVMEINGVKPSTSASGSQPSGNTKKDYIQLTPSRIKSSKLFSVKFGNDHVAKILRYGDYQIGNVMISRVYYLELGVSYTPKADIGIFIGYALTKKGFRIYNRRTRCIIETIHVDFDELTVMASKHSSSGPALHDMTSATISSGLVPNPLPSTPFVPPSRTDWDILFQPLFDELLTPIPSFDCPAPEVIAPITEVVAPEPDVSTGSPSSSTVDHDAPPPSNSQTTPKTQSPIIPNDVEEDNHDLDEFTHE